MLAKLFSDSFKENEKLNKKLDYQNINLEKIVEKRTYKISLQKDEIEQKSLQLQKSNASKDRFFSIISHDLRSPFNALFGFSKLLEKKIKENNTKDIAKYNKIISEVLKQTFALTENLLKWSLIQTDKASFNPEKITVKQIVEENIEILKSTALQKEIKFNVEINDEDIFVFVDKMMVETTLRNLISNAFKFTPRRGSVYVKTIRKDKNIEFSVSDTGIGISPENIEKLFKTYIKHTTKGTEDESGTGLGLILCKEFVLKNSGEIYVESVENKGSKFIFTIPCSPDSLSNINKISDSK